MEKKLTVRESLNLGKGWHLMTFAILAMIVTNAGVNDGLNIILPEIVKGANLDYSLALSMGTIAGFTGVALMWIMARCCEKLGRRAVCLGSFIIFGFAYYFLFLRATNIVMYGIGQCLMVGCGQGCFYIATGPMQSDWFPKKRGVVNGISTIGANLGTAILAPLMIFLLTLGGYKASMSVFPIAAIVLAVYAFITLRDDPLDAGMYPDNVTKEVYEAEYKGLENKDAYVTDWTIRKILTNGDAWLVAIVPGLLGLGLVGIISQFVPRNVSLGLPQEAAVGAMTVAGLVGIIGSYMVGFLDTKMGTKRACMIYSGIFATGVLFNLLASVWLPFVYVSIFIVGFSLGGCNNMQLSFSASVFGPLDYPKILGVTFPITYCIGCLNFVVNGIVLKLTGSLTRAYIVYLCLFILCIILVGAFAEEGKWDKLKHPELRQKTA